MSNGAAGIAAEYFQGDYEAAERSERASLAARSRSPIEAVSDRRDMDAKNRGDQWQHVESARALWRDFIRAAQRGSG